MNVINQWLTSLQKKEKVMIYSVILILFPLISYFLFASEIEDDISRKEANIIKARQTLSSYMKSSKGASIKELSKKVETYKNDLVEYEQDIKKSKEKLFSNTLLGVSEEEWASVLENILDKSIKKDVTITELSIFSKELPYVGEISFIKTLKISGYGQYLHVESLLRHIESYERYFKLDTLNISQEGTSTPAFEVTFNLLGVSK